MTLIKEISDANFSTRYRYEKDESGAVIKKTIDRGFIGLRIRGRAWLESIIKDAGDSDVATVFIYGLNSVGFVIDKKDGVIYVNRAIYESNTNFNRMIEYYKSKTTAPAILVDGLPVSERARAGSQKDLASMIAGAQPVDIEYCDL